MTKAYIYGKEILETNSNLLADVLNIPTFVGRFLVGWHWNFPTQKTNQIPQLSFETVKHLIVCCCEHSRGSCRRGTVRGDERGWVSRKLRKRSFL